MRSQLNTKVMGNERAGQGPQGNAPDTSRRTCFLAVEDHGIYKEKTCFSMHAKITMNPEPPEGIGAALGLSLGVSHKLSGCAATLKSHSSTPFSSACQQREAQPPRCFCLPSRALHHARRARRGRQKPPVARPGDIQTSAPLSC